MTSPTVRALDAPFGVEVWGLDPTRLCDDEPTLATLRALFDDHGLVVFRDVDLSFAAQQELVEALVDAPPSLVDGQRRDGGALPNAYVSNRERNALVPSGRLLFHTDAMWSDDPFALISLYGVNVETGATPTTYANTRMAWETLPDALRRRVDGLHVLHGEGQHVQAAFDPDDELASNPFEEDRTTITPIAFLHPRTGRTLLYVSEQQTREVVELPDPEGADLLAELRAHLYSDANTYEHSWRAGDLAAWDNIAVQHARANVLLDGPVRTLRKVVVPPPWLWSVEYGTVEES